MDTTGNKLQDGENALVFVPSQETRQDQNENQYTELQRKMSNSEKSSSSFLYFAVCAGKFFTYYLIKSNRVL